MEYIYAYFGVVLTLVESFLVICAEEGGELYSVAENSPLRSSRSPFADEPPLDDLSTTQAAVPNERNEQNNDEGLEDKEQHCLPDRGNNVRLCILPMRVQKRDSRNSGKSRFENDPLTRPSRSHYNRADDFLRFGRSNFNLFSRYDRGRDNFIRLGRSKPSRQIFSSQPFDAVEDEPLSGRDAKLLKSVPYDEPLAKHRNVIRLGRAADFLGHGRLSRKAENFIRFGRPDSASDFGHCAHCGYKNRNLNNLATLESAAIFDRAGRSSGGFMRFGRHGGIRLARFTDDLLAQDGADHVYDRNTRKMDHFLRLGRQLGDDAFDWVEEAKRRDHFADGTYTNGRYEIPRFLIGEYRKCNTNEGLSSADVEKCLARSGKQLKYLKDGVRPNGAPSKSPDMNHFARETRRRGLYLRFGRSVEDARNEYSVRLAKVRGYIASPTYIRYGRADEYGPDDVRRIDSYQASGSYNGDGSTYRITEAN